MVELLIILAILPCVVVNLVFATETWLGARQPVASGAARRTLSSGQRIAVLIPAHNEEGQIGATLDALAACGDRAEILVVADNCSDATADMARAKGVAVVVRDDPSRRGKGYALSFGRATLALDPPACVVVLDADTLPKPGAVTATAEAALGAGAPSQGAYVLEAAADSGPIPRFSALAFYVKNVVRQLGLMRLGAPAILTGSGMAFPWPLFERLHLETGEVVEDLVFGIEATLSGEPPVFVPGAWFISGASSDAGTATQRRRWESGFMDAGRRFGGKLLFSRPGRGWGQRAWLGLHLMTPPLMLLLAIDCALAVVLGGVAILSGIWLPLALLALGGGISLGGLLAAMRGHRLSIGWRDLWLVPGYVAWKLVVSLGALIRRERQWLRTERH